MTLKVSKQMYIPSPASMCDPYRRRAHNEKMSIEKQLLVRGHPNEDIGLGLAFKSGRWPRALIRLYQPLRSHDL